MIEIKNIDYALEAHFEWKKRLLKAIHEGKCDVSVEDVAKDNVCEFGKWLYQLPDSDLKIANELNIFETHKSFHLEAATILDLALNNNKTDALTRIENNSNYSRTTRSLVLSMQKWKSLID